MICGCDSSKTSPSVVTDEETTCIIEGDLVVHGSNVKLSITLGWYHRCNRSNASDR